MRKVWPYSFYQKITIYVPSRLDSENKIMHYEGSLTYHAVFLDITSAKRWQVQSNLLKVTITHNLDHFIKLVTLQACFI